VGPWPVDARGYLCGAVSGARRNIADDIDLQAVSDIAIERPRRIYMESEVPISQRIERIGSIDILGLRHERPDDTAAPALRRTRAIGPSDLALAGVDLGFDGGRTIGIGKGRLVR